MHNLFDVYDSGTWEGICLDLDSEFLGKCTKEWEGCYGDPML
jgi:hypothetical protein